MALTIADVERFFAEDPEAAAHYVPASKHAEELEHLKKSQSGSDRTVKELQARIRELETAARPDETYQKIHADLAARERLCSLREQAVRIAAEKGLPIDAALAMAVDESALDKIGKFSDFVDRIKQTAFLEGRREGWEMKKATPGSGSDGPGHYSASVLSKMSVGEVSKKFNDPKFRADWRRFKGAK